MAPIILFSAFTLLKWLSTFQPGVCDQGRATRSNPTPVQPESASATHAHRLGWSWYGNKLIPSFPGNTMARRAATTLYII